MFYFIGDVGEESSEIDRRGVDSGGHQGRNASTGIPWLGEDIWVHLVLGRERLVGREGVDGEQGVGRVRRKGGRRGRLGRHGRVRLIQPVCEVRKIKDNRPNLVHSHRRPM